jgi:cell division protein FtsZ
MKEIQEAASLVQEQAHDDANIIFGASIDESMGEALKVTVIATGFNAAVEELPVEMAREVRRSAPSLRESLAPRSAAPSSRDQVPALSTRRPAAPALAASARDGQMGLPVLRDRISFPSALDADAEWDVPAFQRRQGG